MTRGDRLLIAVLACLALVAWPLASAVAGGRGGQVVLSAPVGETVVSLSRDAVYELQGATGVVTVEVHDGSVSVVESDCPDHTCVRTGAISAPGSVIACVPNGVVVRIGGEGDDGLDARIR